MRGNVCFTLVIDPCAALPHTGTQTNLPEIP